MSAITSAVLPLVAQSDRLPQAAGEVLIELDSEWAYHDVGQNLGTEWMQADYDYSDWERGPGLLGYDTGDRSGRWPAPGLRTNLLENRLVYFFRTEFDYGGPISNQHLVIDSIIDDGAIFYLNGLEIARSKLMPEGVANARMQATGYTNPWKTQAQETLKVENAPLRSGRNVLAVSLHNHSKDSSDICLGVEVRTEEKTEPPLAMYLTWQRDPTTTMTVQWHTDGDTGPPAIEYGLMDSDRHKTLYPESHPMRYSDRLIHTVEITGLNADSEYFFRLSNVNSGVNSPYYKFRTMPAKADRPIRIAVGGDLRHRQEWMEQSNRVAMRFDPHFMVWGGDLAYADGRKDKIDQWYDFFDTMVNTLVTPDGRVVPVLPGIGNHEILNASYYFKGGRGREVYEDTDAFRNSIAPWYYNLFAFPGHPGYGVLDFGDYMSWILLDSDISGPIKGKQTDWLQTTLAERQDVPHVLPIYHVPARPSARSDSVINRNVREHWVPLFEKYGIRVVFENHDHTYKRTVPILDGKADPDGVVFLGDGSWGTRPRVPLKAEEHWFLEKSASIQQLIILTVQGNSQDYKIINSEGNLIDHYIPPPVD